VVLELLELLASLELQELLASLELHRQELVRQRKEPIRLELRNRLHRRCLPNRKDRRLALERSKLVLEHKRVHRQVLARSKQVLVRSRLALEHNTTCETSGERTDHHHISCDVAYDHLKQVLVRSRQVRERS